MHAITASRKSETKAKSKHLWGREKEEDEHAVSRT